MSDFKDIWPEDEGAQKLSEEQLMAYMEGRLPEAERHSVESLLAGEGMESDALEGLQNLSAGEVESMRRRLNADLQKTLIKKRRKRRGMTSQRWNTLAIVILLLLIVICFALFWVMRHK